jgi:hypothetical protein
MDWCQLNLAAIKYRDIQLVKKSPINKIYYNQTDDGYIQAFAFLREELVGIKGTEKIYGAADGTGTSKHKHIAVYKAVSEAIERWAYFNTCSSVTASTYGFDSDSSTSGMAAYPGLFKCQARKLALCEAMERWNVCSWWEKKVEHEKVAENSIVIKNSKTNLETTLTWTKHLSGNFFAYGFACAPNPADSLEKARIEMNRNLSVLSKFFAKHNAETEETRCFLIKNLDLKTEKRLVFFSTEFGHNIFLKRLAASVSNSMANSRLLIDTEIPGPWTKYATVWRCLFETDNSRNFSNEIEYFMF